MQSEEAFFSNPLIRMDKHEPLSSQHAKSYVRSNHRERERERTTQLESAIEEEKLMN